MIYKVKKTSDGFTLTEKDGTERIFDSAQETAMFLAGWAIKDMKEDEEKLVTDVEIANAMI